MAVGCPGCKKWFADRAGRWGWSSGGLSSPMPDHHPVQQSWVVIFFTWWLAFTRVNNLIELERSCMISLLRPGFRSSTVLYWSKQSQAWLVSRKVYTDPNFWWKNVAEPGTIFLQTVIMDFDSFHILYTPVSLDYPQFSNYLVFSKVWAVVLTLLFAPVIS